MTKIAKSDPRTREAATHRGDEMINAFTEELAMIEADASPPGADVGRISSDSSRSRGDRHIYLRFKPGNGQPVTPVRVSRQER
jgi:hypothetical protein